jgi:Nucleotidyl transferase AbiEii toxin, Type IV TA system
MTEPFPYTSAQAFNAALTARIKTAAKTSPYNASQLRKQFAYDRLLARLFADPAGGWILKGGISMITRLPVARHTADVDLAAKDRTIQQALADLKARSEVDLGDFFGFRLDPPRTLVQGVEGVRVAVTSNIGFRLFERFGVDLVTGTLMTGLPETGRPILDLGIPGLINPDYVLYPIADTLADKISATVELHNGRPSTRFRDLVDIVLIARHRKVAAETAKTALASERVRRGLELPMSFDVPDRTAWARGYMTAARDVPGLAEKDVEAALIIAKALADPLLDGSAEGIWDPGLGAWG